MQIVNLMTPDPITIDQHDTLSKAKTIMDEGNFRRVPVVDDGRLVGIVTERDLREYYRFPGIDASDRRDAHSAHHRHAVRHGGRCGPPDAEAQNRRPADCR